jgi:(1->4)-alpha-D-glucan 1-alpha-D-glucosylmutase
MSARLASLAALHGIGLEYQDIWGNSHRVPDASLVALLEAMGVKATGEEAIEASIAAYEAMRWRAVLPPAIVVPADASERRFRLHLAAALDGAALGWRVEEESGALRTGTVRIAELPALEQATIDGTRYVARELALELPLPAGYHRLEILQADLVIGACRLAAVPRRCYMPPALEGDGKVWGASVQLYGVRSERNWGIGDYTDLRSVVERWGERGAGIVSVNPLHALFAHNPTHASPYSPSSRLFNNVLYIDVEAVEDFGECRRAREVVRAAPFQSQLAALRDSELVDYAAVASAKLPVLELLFEHFRTQHLPTATPRARAFRAFQAEGGEALRRYALFEAIQERFHHDDPSIWGWPAWRDPFRDPISPECDGFADEHTDRVEFFEYLQWQADEQLARVAQRAIDSGLGVGLCADLAISIDRSGAEAWAHQGLYAAGVGIGAPPDDFNPVGQDWGLPPVVPERLCAARYEPFIAVLRANMRHAGALRIDHVMGLARLFWVPAGGLPADGAYVRYPFADLLGIVALESHRNRCLVIGEDLGTVPDEVRAALGAAGVLSYRLLYFERGPAGEFKSPGEYPGQALAAATTHDLPTLAGWWTGHDITVRAELGLLPAEARDAQVLARSQDRARLLLALEREGLLPEGATADPVSLPEMTPAFARAIAVYLGRSAARILIVQLEDVLGLASQANVPGSTTEHPNWRRKVPLALERWTDDERFIELARALAPLRGHAPAPRRSRTEPLRAVIPRATYRLQLHQDFTFADATAIVPYLAELGISHVYCSPYLRARPGSRHGYDIVDHASLNPEIGTVDDFNRFVAILKRHGLGQIADIVPNHMGIMGADNAWWMDVLENGPASAYAEYFDIDWNPIDPTLAGKVLVPVLGDHYGNVLERGELVLRYEPDAGSFALWYHEHRCPIDPREYPRILTRVSAALGPGVVPAHATADFESLTAAFGHLPPRDATGREARAERGRDKEVHKGHLAQLARAHPALAEAIERGVRAVNGVTGERESFAALDELLGAQAYRLAYWRVAGDEINYRRFFHINELAALRVENEAVFESTHRFVLELAAEGSIEGLRIDHPDGLYDPGQYFCRLQERYAQLAGATAAAAPDGRPLYVVVEKITAPHERLPESWPVHGTTGYRFANVVTGLLVDTAAKSRVDRTWRAFVGDEAMDFEEAAYRAKRLVMKSALAGELTVLANRALRIARSDWRTRDFTFNSLRQAIAEMVACFPVYRTYIADRVSPQDRRIVDWAVAHAKRRSTTADLSVFDFLKSVVLVRPPAGATAELEAEYRGFAMRFQQFTAPVAAKGVEDTAFYVFNRLVALNEVGGDPEDFGMAVTAFHGASSDRSLRSPHTMLATSTHDSKRSEDVRARIAVISELPAAWRLAVRGWSRANRGKKRAVDARPAPTRNDEYLLYQTLAGTFPTGTVDDAALATYRTRIKEYMLKAAREAKVRTSWINPNEGYESAVAGFVDALLDRLEGNAFLEEFRRQVAPIAWFGALNSLSLALVKFTSPGVPDIYQGQELIELTLVDPDNRRAVDYAMRREALVLLRALAADAADGLAGRVRALLEAPHDGRAKLWVTWRLLDLRRRRSDVFEKGDYRKIAVTGAQARHVVAYARQFGATGIVVVAGRLFATLGLEHGMPPVGEAAWGDAAVDLAFVPAGTVLENVLTGEVLVANGGAVAVAQAFAHFPGAVFTYEARGRDPSK